MKATAECANQGICLHSNRPKRDLRRTAVVNIRIRRELQASGNPGHQEQGDSMELGADDKVVRGIGAENYGLFSVEDVPWLSE